MRQGFSISKKDVKWFLTHGPESFVAKMTELYPGAFPQHFVFPVAVMGSAQSAQLTTRYSRRMTRLATEWGMLTFGYADEWLMAELNRMLAFCFGAINFCKDHLFGFAFTWSKTNPFPTQTPEFIGYEHWTVTLRRRPLWRRVEETMTQARSINQRSLDDVPMKLREDAQFTSRVIGMREGARKNGLKVRPAIEDLTANLRRSKQDYDAVMPISQGTQDLASWVMEWMDFEMWAYMRTETPKFRLTSDASPYGWSGHDETTRWNCRGHFGAELKGIHHNIQEVLAGDFTTVHYVEHENIRGTDHVPICIGREQGNTTAIKVVNALPSLDAAKILLESINDKVCKAGGITKCGISLKLHGGLVSLKVDTGLRHTGLQRVPLYEFPREPPGVKLTEGKRYWVSALNTKEMLLRGETGWCPGIEVTQDHDTGSVEDEWHGIFGVL